MERPFKSPSRGGRLGRALASLSATIALLAAIAAAVGVFARGDGAFVTVTSVRGESYEMATTGIYANNALQLVAEGIGWDIFTLVIAVPALLVAAFLTWRGSFRGSLVAAGMLGYFFYMHLEYAVTWALGPLFPLFIALYGASLVGLVGFGALFAWQGTAGRFTPRFPRRSWAALSIGMSAMLTVLWVGRIAEALASPGAPALHGEVTMTIQALDLGLVVPLSVLIAVTVLRGEPAGLVAAAAFSVTFLVMTASIAAMMVSSWVVTGVPAVEPIVVFGVASLLGLLIAVRIYRSLVPSSKPSAARAALLPRLDPTA
ncbi:MAG TPA: hypothetical protein VF365_10255 [Candidatus Limnocylindria bacterium]